MLKITYPKYLLCYTAIFMLLLPAAQAQFTPLWQDDFESYSDGQLLADKDTYHLSDYNWRLRNGSNTNMPAANAAKVSELGGNKFALVYANPADGLDARFEARRFIGSGASPINWDHSGDLVFRGDIRAEGVGNTATNKTNAFYWFNGAGTAVANPTQNVQWTFAFGINNNSRFYASFYTPGVGTEVFTSDVSASADLWYSFVAVFDKDTNVATISAYDNNSSLVWSAQNTHLFKIGSINMVEMSVNRPNGGERIAGFDNIAIGVIPEPATTAAMILLVVGVAGVIQRRRRRNS